MEDVSNERVDEITSRSYLTPQVIYPRNFILPSKRIRFGTIEFSQVTYAENFEHVYLTIKFGSLEFAHEVENTLERPVSEQPVNNQAGEGNSAPGSTSSGPKGLSVPELQVAAESEDHDHGSIQPKLDYNPAHPTTFSAPLDDNIEQVLPDASTDKPPSTEEVDAYINKVMTDSTTRKRLAVFAEICPNDE